MNYVFLRERVENSPFTPIQQKCLDSIGSRVPSKLKESPETQEMLEELNKEISDNFREVIIKHTGKVFCERVCVCKCQCPHRFVLTLHHYIQCSGNNIKESRRRRSGRFC